jgi:cellulose synthase/poly-beta-1,6-N-acetylglucosamine synthase-like glycosyltransferase
MRITTFLLLVCSAVTFSHFTSQTGRKNKQDPTVSIIIPCYPGHFKFLKELIFDFCQQSVLPEEIVISLSEADKIDKMEIEHLRHINLPFKLILIENTQKLYAGENRNIAAAKSTGDIIICQDADDKPHPQRIEIIKSQFAESNIDHLIHGYSKIANDLDFSIHGDPKNFEKRFRLTAGNIAIKKEVFAKIKWTNIPRGEDCKFNKDVKKAGFKSVKLFLPLLFYRQNLSSIRDNS